MLPRPGGRPRRGAGGHSYGGLPSLALVPLIVDAVAPSLVLAAGGIADGRGLAAALMLGADGDLLGVPGPPANLAAEGHAATGTGAQ